jgi:hypothetical protein
MLGLLIPDDGGSTHLWNVGRQSFYTAVHPRRQFWTSFFRLVNIFIDWIYNWSSFGILLETQSSTDRHSRDCEKVGISDKTSKKYTLLDFVMLVFRVVFWVILPCKMIVDWRFRGVYCLHHQGWVSLARKDWSLYRCPVPGWPVVVRDDRLGTGQWQWAGSWFK